MTKHTPGPWEIRKGEPWVIAKAYGNMKSVVHLNLPVEQSENQKADARLIAAAPELLEALEKALWGLEYHTAQTGSLRLTNGAMQVARAAIAKATGGEV